MNETMIKTLAFSDEVVAYWDRAESFTQGYRYRIDYDDVVAYAEKTHYTIARVRAGQEIVLAVTLVDADGKTIETIGKTKVLVPSSSVRSIFASFLP